jgi:hypothetical protein
MDALAAFEADISRACLLAVRARAHARRQMARQQSGSAAIVSARLALTLDQIASELEAEARR